MGQTHWNEVSINVVTAVLSVIQWNQLHARIIDCYTPATIN